MGIEIEQLIKIIIGLLVVIAVVVGIYFLFKNRIFDFFKGLSVGDSNKFFLSLLK
jgi:nitrate reductase gamma subunit